MTSSEPPRGGFRFTWRGRTLDYCDHPYNQTAANERTVEVPIANWWVDRQSGDGCEFGCVLPHYRPDCTWRVIDLADDTRPAEPVDIFAVTDRFDWIVSVSTVEHVRWDEWAWLGLPVGEWPRNPHGAWAALSHLYYGMLRPGGRLLVTVPLGAHPFLDARLQGVPAERAAVPGCRLGPGPRPGPARMAGGAARLLGAVRRPAGPGCVGRRVHPRPTRGARAMTAEQGPWTYDEISGLVEFGSSDWHGGPRPPDLPAGCAPGGLAFGLWEPPHGPPLDVVCVPADAADDSRIRTAAERHAAQVHTAGPLGPRGVIWDGDSGRPAMMITAGETADR